MTVSQMVTTGLLIVEYLIKVVAIGTVPENRRPSSSQAWLLLILLVPAAGLPLYLLIGSANVRGRRHQIQAGANELLQLAQKRIATLPDGVFAPPELRSILEMNRRLTSLPCVTGINDGLFGDTAAFYDAVAQDIDRATKYVHVEIYIMAWDETTDVFFTALAEAVERGVRVRLLMDHLGSRRYPGWRKFRRRLTDTGIDWHLMMPIDLLRGRWRRPDLRNHRKLVIIDGDVACMGSHNMIDPHYGSRRNRRIDRQWQDLSIRLTGNIVLQLEAVFAVDWYSETHELLDDREHFVEKPEVVTTEGSPANAMQLVPSGPGFATEPNLRLFAQLVATATERIGITSPYFVPDETLLTTITTAAYRGVRVDLFVGEEADQFLVGHAQRSYYRALLEAGVRIHLYPAPTILHSKFLVVDDKVGAIGSSNMDYRSFALDYEITLLGFGGDLVDKLREHAEAYLRVSHELTLDEWLREPWYRRYVDNVARLTSALM